MSHVPALAYVLAAGGVGLVAGWFLCHVRYERIHGQARQLSDRLVREAEKEAHDIVKTAELEAKEEFYQARQRFEQETEEVRAETRRRVEGLDLREENLNKKVAFIDQKETRLDQQDEQLRRRQDELGAEQARLDELLLEQTRQLEQIAGMSAENARQLLKDKFVSDARHAAAKTVQEIRAEAERTSRREVTKILSLAIQRYAADHVAESTVSVVDLPSDDMKGRIIGREGRNIRAFELTAGVDVIIDDTPGAVIVSAFDPVRREIARQSLETLVRDGRIHPGRIEEVIRKTTAEMQEKIKEIGEHACLDIGVQNVNPDLFPYIGRLAYRTSYGQNLLKHSAEVAAVSAVIASELGLDAGLAKRCGFLHDIGKAADHEIEGPHAMIGARLCRKFGESEIVLNAVGGHHHDVEPTSAYTFITAAADAVSASRPGARRESVDSYVQRLENLEQIADGFEGVEKCFAIQAGREVRVMVDHNKVSDAEASVLAEEISRRIEGELEYPGQIKIMVIRESRATAYAR